MEISPGLRIQNYANAASHLGIFLSNIVKDAIIKGLRMAGMPARCSTVEPPIKRCGGSRSGLLNHKHVQKGFCLISMR
jgi:hypothetical protein